MASTRGKLLFNCFRAHVHASTRCLLSKEAPFLDHLERLDSGLRACAAGGPGGPPIVPDIRENARYRKYTISVYCDIANTSGMTSVFFGSDIRISRYFLQYLDHIGPDIGEKPDIGFGKERVCPDIDPISVLISGKKPRSGPILVISGLARNGYVPILYRYRRRYYQHRVRYREK